MPLLVLCVIVASYFLPFGKVNYAMHSIAYDETRQLNEPIPITTEHIPINIFIYGVCHQENKLQHILKNRITLLNAGNYVSKEEKVVHRNRLQMILDTNLTAINNFLCRDEEGPRLNTNPQVATWVAAGLVVLLLLTIAGILSLLCAAAHVLAIWQARDDPNWHKLNSVVRILSDSISWIVLFASILYVAFTWGERGSQNRLGPGCISMIICAIIVHVDLLHGFGRLRQILSKEKGNTNTIDGANTDGFDGLR